MRLLEFEAKLLLAEAGITTPPELVTASAAEAAAFARTLGAPVVLKAQVPVGGRMKAGGVRFATDPDRAAAEAGQLLALTIKGYAVERIAVQEQIVAGGTFYLAATFDAARRSALLLASAEGGIEVESAGQVFQQPFSLRQSFPLFRARELAAQTLHAAATARSGVLAGGAAASASVAQPVFDDSVRTAALQPLTDVIYKLVQFFQEHDVLLAEINPLLLVVRPGAAPVFVAVDAHVELDDDALFRHRATRTDGLPGLVERFGLSGRGERKRTALEQQAAEIDGADHRGVAGRVVEFEGDLALLIGGGGASLTIFDAILDAGGKPANYCEIGGNPSVWKIAELTKLLLSKPGVTRLAVIMNVVNNTRADLVARGVIKGILESGREPSEVIAAFRIPGSWEEEGNKILSKYNVRYYGREVSLDEVAQRVVNP
jgi:succinyl-CoA synthetase beta subunit